jgi:hypothetical protein
MNSEHVDHATPTIERCVTSYPARRGFRPGVIYPPAIPDVQDAIDIHCHCHEGQQDALALAKLASESGMLGILFKTIGAIHGEYLPQKAISQVSDALNRWADEKQIRPIHCWAGYVLGMDNKPPTLEKLRMHLDTGVRGVWLPVFNHANTYSKVGGKKIWMDPTADPNEHTAPLSWEEALKVGHYLLDDHGKLKPFYQDVVRMVTDYDVALFFGHATHPEIRELAALADKLRFRRAVIDHPFSPFVDLTTEMMKELAAIGIHMNFTFDELSPLLGVDPKEMYSAIRAVGVEHFTLSSDAGEPLFPHSVECMRLIRGYMRAFGLNDAEIYSLCTVEPAMICGLDLVEKAAPESHPLARV